MELTTQKVIIFAASVLLAAGYLCYPFGYGTLSDGAYDLALASYGACLAKSESRVDKIEAILDDPEYAAKLSDQEIGWFRNLISQSRSDRWDQATTIAKQMMQDQVQ